MVFNAMYPVGQRPTFITNRRIKKKEDEESSNSSAAQKEVEEQPVLKHEGNDEFTKTIDTNAQTTSEAPSNAVSSPVSIANSNISYANINPEINIAQILNDYQNTANAIGTPPELQAEVDTYLQLVQKEVQKDDPNTKIVKSNLKNAAIILDNYITETLQRPSKVVENWADALFLQKINYKYDNKDVNEQFLVKFPNRTANKTETTTSNPINSSNTDAANTTAELSMQIPEDSKLTNLFLKAKKYSSTDNSENALATYQQALARADEVGDTETKAKIHYEMGQIYFKNDNLSDALKSYNEAATNATDANVKTKSYYSMAQIYDYDSNLNTAINNYMASISYAGEAENFKAQSTSLTKIGNIFTDKYDKTAFDFYSEASTMADVSDDSKTKGFVATNTADAYTQFKQPKEALSSYFSAVKNYSDSDSPKKVAQNYQKAAQVMFEYGNPKKAKSLLLKAQKQAAIIGDTSMLAEINSQLNTL